MKQPQNSSPVPRYQVFALEDGEVVVQWSETRVQEIASGRYREYNARNFGRRLSDYELDRLQEARVIEHYNRAYIWLYALPEAGRFDGLQTKETSHQPRFYYLNTTLPASYLEEVRIALTQSQLADSGAQAHDRDHVIAITGEDGMLFPTLEEAETALKLIIESVPLLERSLIAFANIASFSTQESDQTADAPIDLDALIADADSRHKESPPPPTSHPDPD